MSVCPRVISCLLLCLSSFTAAGETVRDGANPAPDVATLTGLPKLTGTAPTSPTFSPDRDTVAFLWNDHGMPFRDIWTVAVDGDGLERLTALAPEPGSLPYPPEETSVEAMKQRLAERADSGISEIVWGPDGDWLYFLRRGELRRVHAKDGRMETVADTGPGRSRLTLSPDGSHLGFLWEGDIWVHELASGENRRLTELGVPGIGQVSLGAYNRPDAYVSEYHWSPDGESIALVHMDQREVRRVPIPSYLHEEPILHEVRRPYPGDHDLVRHVGVIDIEGGSVSFIGLEGSDRRHVLELQWSPGGERLLIMQGADVAEDRWIHVAGADGGEAETVWHDHRPNRIYPLFRARWSADGRAIHFIGDTEGFYRLYTLPLAGGEPRMRTTGDYDVAGIRGPAWMRVDDGNGDLFFVSTEHSPYERQVYRLGAEAETPERLTRLAGIHEPTLSPDGRTLALITANDTTPAELYLMSVDAPGSERRITYSPLPEFDDYDWITPRYVQFPSRTGDYTIHARIIEPPNLDESKRYPVIFGNIYSNTVRNDWSTARPTSLLQQRMALAGEYINVQVDLRGSVGYGVAFREAFQGDWGRGDLEDIHSAVDYLETLPYVDTDRMGIWGNSYGGLMTLSALFRKPGLFAAGVAGAPAVDVWHFTGFDQHLTRRPETHPGIFEQGSLMDLGEDLADPLLIIHGMHDDIVPYKTTRMLVEKLTLLGKPFELLSVHDSGHWWAAREDHALRTFRRLLAFFHRHVPPGGTER